LRHNDPSLTTVLEDRRSVREHDHDRPITADQLGEFLYRCARVRGTNLLDGIEHVDRPFPSGGALHELEIYPVIRQADGLEPGMYHYDGHEHVLRPVCPENEHTRTLFTAAELATGSQAPQVLLVIAARFGRLLWKYQAMGYSAILKDAGVLYQVMYSVATAMGLAACGIGGGHAEVFNQATGRDYLVEGVVGEFLLGSAANGKDTHS
jgi:SagB-type dehydrogenase family enzyme